MIYNFVKFVNLFVNILHSFLTRQNHTKHVTFTRLRAKNPDTQVAILKYFQVVRLM